MKFLLPLLLIVSLFQPTKNSKAVEKKITVYFPVGIYKGDAYKHWYIYNKSSWTSLPDDHPSIVEHKSDPSWKSYYRTKNKADRREAKAHVIKKIKVPFTLVLKLSNDQRHPWKIDRIEGGFYEDDLLKFETSEIEHTHSTANFRILAINKHIHPHYEFLLGFSIILYFKDGKFSSTSVGGSGMAYSRVYPHVYKQSGRKFSFIPFYHRFKKAWEESIEEAFLEL